MQTAWANYTPFVRERTSETYHPLIICNQPEWSGERIGSFAAIQFVDGKFVREGNMSDEEAVSIFMQYVPHGQEQSMSFDYHPASSSIEKNRIALSRAIDGSFNREASHPVDEPVWTLFEAILDRVLSETNH